MDTEPDTAPDVLTVEEVASILRIGRNSAYALARQWLATNGREGLPAVRLGRSVRIPRTALERILACGLTTTAQEGHNVVPLERSRPAGTL